MAKKVEIRALTGFRGVAALIVALYHFSRALGSDRIFSVGPGYIAVDAFFVLSGYVLAYNYASIFSARFSSSDYREFLIKRVCRIYPAYLAILSIAAVKLHLNMGGGEQVTLQAWDAFCNIFMLTGWGLHATPIIGVSWSVSAELFCYILFPLIALIAAQGTAVLAVIAVGALAVVGWLSHMGLGVQGPMDIVSPDHSFSLIRALCGFILGVIGYSLSERAGSGRLRMADYLLPVSVVALALSWLWDATDLLSYLIIVLIVWLIAQGSRVGEGLFGNKPVYYLGQISYSLYLIHPLLVSGFTKIAKRLSPSIGLELSVALALCAYLAVAIALAHLSWFVFEKHGQRVMLRILMPGRRAAA